jgi:hypothetical protein
MMGHGIITDDEIQIGVRTVCQIHEFFAELKAKVGELKASIGVVDRGYFAANEDDAARGLLLSYWQSRNALFELISSFRARVQLSRTTPPGEFLVPFAAALILVDAARFLRQVAESRPIVRRKLNEPAPTFGIPGGSYDAIQKSLLSARHAWLLSQACQFFDDNEVAFTSALESSDLRPVLEIARRLRNCANVQVAHYAKAKLTTRWDQLLRWLGRNTAVRAVYGIQQLGAGLMADVYVRPGHQPNIPAEIGQRLRAEVLRQGDVLLVRKEYALTNYFLPGHWPHVALFLGDHQSSRALGQHQGRPGNPWQQKLNEGMTHCVLESMKDGVHIRSLDSPLASDSVVVIRPRLTEKQILDGMQRGLAHAGKPYDFDFDFRRSDRLVCTEVIYRSYEGVGSMRFPLVKRMGRPTLSGSDLLGLCRQDEMFDLIAVFAPTKSPDLLSDAAATQLIDSVE